LEDIPCVRDLYNLFIGTAVKYRREIGHVTWMGEMRDAYTILVRKLFE
jgi:hypothetical protein